VPLQAASLLLAPLVRFLPPDDPRIRSTVLAIADELTVDGLVLRYRVEEMDDGLFGPEGTFTICSFWLVSALAEIGEVHRAQHLLERFGVNKFFSTGWATCRRHGPYARA
jgi:alpha,alpha-trehalase